MTRQLAPPPAQPWRGMTREQYDALVARGLMTDRVELIEGDIVEMVPQSEEHSDAIVELTRWLVPRVDGSWRVRPQTPLAATDRSEPEPDIAVAERTVGHPMTAAPAREVVVHTDPGPTGYRLVRRQPWEQPLSVPVGEGITVDLASVLCR